MNRVKLYLGWNQRLDPIQERVAVKSRNNVQGFDPGSLQRVDRVGKNGVSADLNERLR